MIWKCGGKEVAKECKLLIEWLNLLNCNTYSYRIIKELVPLHEHLLSIIECGYFNASQLQQLILSRHKSSGIKLKYNGKLEETISPLSLSLLFNSYFNFSKGIPGVAMNAWKANIIDANSDVITVKKPSIPSVDMLQNLEPDMLIVIALFIQHKTMNTNKLSRITGFDVDISEQLINKLINMGLAVPKGNSSIAIGRNIEPFLVEVCANKGLI